MSSEKQLKKKEIRMMIKTMDNNKVWDSDSCQYVPKNWKPIMSSKEEIKQLKKDIMFEIDFRMSLLKNDYDYSTFNKSDITQTFKSLKKSIKYKLRGFNNGKL